MKSLSLEKENIIKDIRNRFRLKKEKETLKHFKMEYLKILGMFLSKKKKKIIKKLFNMKVMVIEISYYQLKNLLINLGIVTNFQKSDT